MMEFGQGGCTKRCKLVALILSVLAFVGAALSSELSAANVSAVPRNSDRVNPNRLPREDLSINVL